MPNRIIKESIRTSYEIDELSVNAEVTFYRLLTFADDFGRFPSDIRILQSQLFPLKASIRSNDFDTWISELVKTGLIQLYIGADNKPYGTFSTWEDHQTIRNKKSKYPEPEGERYESLSQQLKAIEIKRNQLESNVTVIQSNPIQSESNPESESKPKGEGPVSKIEKAETKEELLEIWEAYRKEKGKHMTLYERDVLLNSTWLNESVHKIKKSLLYTMENGWWSLQYPDNSKQHKNGRTKSDRNPNGQTYEGNDLEDFEFDETTG